MNVPASLTPPGAAPIALIEIEKLCDLLLEVAGRDTTRLQSVARHVRVLDAALPHMTPAQAAMARSRIDRFETKWGPLLARDQYSSETDGVPPIQRVANWLATRRNPERLLLIPYLAAVAVHECETSMSRIYEVAYRMETDGKLMPRGIDTFREWLIQLRIVRREREAVYVPGALCEWWVAEMSPSSDRRSAYAACLKLRQRMLQAQVDARYR